jgi:predicted nucleic acid-binding protein
LDAPEAARGEAVTFDDLPDGSPIFIDANTFVYHFDSDPQFGAACTRLMRRIALGLVTAFTSTQILGDVAHRLMANEAAVKAGLPLPGTARYLQRHPAVIQQLTRFRQAVEDVLNGPFRTLAITAKLTADALSISQQHGLLHNDALIVAVMQAHGLTNLASHDADFDPVPGLTRFAPA